MSQTQTHDRLFQTLAATVILPKGARHIDNTNGYTACGIETPEGSHHSLGSIDGKAMTRISCGYCAKGIDYPGR